MSDIQRWVRPEVLKLSAYHVPESVGMVKLDAMENPYLLPSELQAKVGQLAAEAWLNRYPDPHAKALKQRLRTVFEIPANQDLILGNGSDELIQLLALTLAKPGAMLLGVEPSFVMYRMVAQSVGMQYLGIPLQESDFSLDLPALLAAITTHQPALIFLAYPNNPTGNAFTRADIEQILAVSEGLVVIDEAYHAFAQDSFLPQLAEYPNLLVMRTVSKLGLAGLRLGFLAGNPAWLHEIDKLRLPYNINVLTQAVAEFVLSHHEILDQQAAQLRHERTKLFDTLQDMAHVVAYPSDANFILLRVPQADLVHQRLLQQQILVKNLHHAHPLLHDCLRVTVSTPEENAQFIHALQKSLLGKS